MDFEKICYVFDVDGTLTEARKPATNDFVDVFTKWAINKQLYIATGSDFVKTKEQLPQEVLDCFKLIYCCMGNEVRNSDGQIIKKNEFLESYQLETVLEGFLQDTNYRVKTGRHLEYRTGMVNFSIVGRNATHKQRKAYTKWDNTKKEREKIAEFINENFDLYEASVGGSISIDIIMKGKDKGQVIQELVEEGAKKIVFCGDRCLPGGNDYGIIRELSKSDLAYEWYQVSGPQDVINLIQTNKVFI